MQVSVESTGKLERRMRVEFPAARIDQEVNSRLKKVGKTAKISGFRPGKVPPKVVKQRYGQQIRRKQLLGRAVLGRRIALGLERFMMPIGQVFLCAANDP